MTRKSNHRWNEYRCSIETNQCDKYCVRIRARFPRNGWVVTVYFLASTFERAIKKLEDSVQFLQKHEDRLWFWGVDHSDDPNVSAEMLLEAGLRIDRRAEFPRRNERLAIAPEERIAPFKLRPVRRALAESIEASRSVN